MKSDKRRFALWGAAAFAALLALGFGAMWVADNVFNGAVLDYLESLVIGTDASNDAVFFNTGRLASFGLAAVILLSALLSATGAVCAYRAHARQKKLLDAALAEAERAREAAQREMQRKNDLITYLAHDLKTPLASVIAYLSLLAESPDLDAAHRAKYTGIALDKAYRLEQLIGELFEIIRFNLQKIELDRRRFHLKLLLEQLAEEFYPILLSQGKRLAIDCDETLALDGDPDKLARVFNNLLKNAVAYSDENTEIDVSARREGGRAVIRVANRGAQIPQEKLNRIFEKFYRADESRSTRTGGAGLGLAIAKEIVLAHGGSVSAESAPERTVFTVTLPEAKPALPSA